MKKTISAPPSHLPTLITPEPKRDCYCSPHTIQQEATAGFSRAWMIDGKITTLLRRDGSYLKNIERFPDHALEPDKFYAFLEECYKYGTYRPSAYHDPIYKTLRMPVVKWSINALLAPQLAGGWNAALLTGVFAGTWFVYDIQSAYLSALTKGLPAPSSFRFSREIGPRGVYVIEQVPRADLPHPYDFRTIVNATAEEIETYGLTVRRVIGGVEWGAPFDWESIYSAIRALSFWKQAGRAYWGRWAMSERIEVIGGNTGSVTQMKSIFTNMVWAHLILGRIRLRLFNESRNPKGDVLHVFTDSIITNRLRKVIPNTVGEWKLDRVYDNGVYVKGAGMYGPMFGPLDKWAGVPIADRMERR